MFTQRMKNLVHRLIPDALTLSPSWLTLESGLRVRIDSKLTLELFVELFVTQPYRAAMVLVKNPQFIVDLGANRGFFMLYATDYLKHGGGGVNACLNFSVSKGPGRTPSA